MKTKTIYIDWNLYSILKKPVLEPHLLLHSFLTSNKKAIRLVYSPAHLGDLAQTSENFNERRNEDLKYLSEKTNNKCIVGYWGTSDIIIDNRDPLEFFETNEIDNSHPTLEMFDSFRRIFTDQYGMIRDQIVRHHFRVEPSEICNFSKNQLDQLIKMVGVSPSLEEFLKFGLHLRTSPTDVLSYIDFYYTAYINLDLINFFPDSMVEEGEFENLKNDALHSAYGSLCDAFITNDNKCFHKSKFLFNYYKCSTTLIRTCKVKNIALLENQLDSILE
jgi:hypothetical protein